jgi:hypothetical protein
MVKLIAGGGKGVRFEGVVGVESGGVRGEKGDGVKVVARGAGAIDKRCEVVIVDGEVEEKAMSEQVKVAVVFGEAMKVGEPVDVHVAVYADEVTVERWMAGMTPDDDLVKEFVGLVGKVQGELWNAVGEVLDGVAEEWKGFVHEQKRGEEYPVKMRLSKEDARIEMKAGRLLMRLDGSMGWIGWKLSEEEGEELVRIIVEGTRVPKHRVTWEG